MMSKSKNISSVCQLGNNKNNNNKFANNHDVFITNVLDNNTTLTKLIGNCKIVPLKGDDGNCVYRAFAREIYGNESLHYHVRNECADMMVTEWEYFEPMYNERKQSKHITFAAKIMSTRGDVTRHGDHMREPTMASQFEIMVLAIKHQVTIHIYYRERSSNELVKTVINPDFDHTMHLFYAGGAQYDYIEVDATKDRMRLQVAPSRQLLQFAGTLNIHHDNRTHHVKCKRGDDLGKIIQVHCDFQQDTHDSYMEEGGQLLCIGQHIIGSGIRTVSAGHIKDGYRIFMHPKLHMSPWQSVRNLPADIHADHDIVNKLLVRRSPQTSTLGIIEAFGTILLENYILDQLTVQRAQYSLPLADQWIQIQATSSNRIPKDIIFELYQSLQYCKIQELIRAVISCELRQYIASGGLLDYDTPDSKSNLPSSTHDATAANPLSLNTLVLLVNHTNIVKTFGVRLLDDMQDAIAANLDEGDIAIITQGQYTLLLRAKVSEPRAVSDHATSTSDRPKPQRPSARKQRKLLRTTRQKKITEFLTDTSGLEKTLPMVTERVQELRILTQNTNGQSNSPTGKQQWAHMIKISNIDITVLVDDRTTEKDAAFHHSDWRSWLPGYVVHSATTKPSGEGRVGGMTFILSPKLGTATKKRFYDDLQMGVAAAVLLTVPGMHLLVIGTYWTTLVSAKHLQEKNSLWRRIERELEQKGYQMTPLEYIQGCIEKWIHKAKVNGWIVMLLGDLNSGWNSPQGQHGDCREWANQFGLSNQPYDLAKSRGERLITRPNINGGTTIDHILTSSYRLQCTDIISTNGLAPEYRSDHMPLAATFKCHNVVLPEAYVPEKENHIDLQISNKPMVEEYTEMMKNGNIPILRKNATTQEAADYLDDLCAYAVSSVALITKKVRKKKFFQGWSPTLMTHMYHIRMLLKIRRQLPKWQKTGTDFKPEIKRVTSRLIEQLRSLQKDKSTLPDISVLEIDGFNIEQWHQTSLANMGLIVAQHIKSLKKQLHLEQRMQDRIIISKYTQLNETKFKNRKYKQLLNSIFGNYRTAIDQLITDTGDIELDPIKIHDTITEYLEKIHSLNSADIDTDWKGAVAGKPFLQNESNVPDHLKDILRRSFAKHADNRELQDAMRAKLYAPVTFEEFVTEIDERANNKSGGISAFTPNMLKSLPIEVKSEIFAALNKLWIHRNTDHVIPESWLHRWICTVPKVKGACDITQIRPISLYEVLRKVWTALINRRISSVWDQQQVLHPSQHAYRHSIGGDTELLQIINVIEDADAYNREVILTSFDTAKAFDSVSKRLMIAAWMRLGIPEDIAEYLVLLDADGVSIPKTQHAISVLGQLLARDKMSKVHTDKTIKSTIEQIRAFLARDGIGQGDSPSANAWTAIFDILLCALDDNQYEPYTYHERDGELAKCKPLAYADDLNTISPSLEHAQMTADIVSAYNYITGFKTNVTKIECVSNSTSKETRILTIHDEDWRPFRIPLSTKTECKVLGIQIDLHNKWAGLRHAIEKKIQDICRPIINKRVRIGSKALAYTMVAIPSIVYKAKFLNYSNAEYENLFRPVASMLRQIMQLQRSFPQHLLYIREKYGGLQLADLVEQVNMHKMGSIYRALRAQSPAISAGKTILERCFQQEAVTITGSDVLQNDGNVKSWFGSVIEWQAQCGFYLRRHLPHSEELLSELPITQFCSPENRAECDEILAAYDISKLRDITAMTRDRYRARYPDHPVNKLLAPTLPLISNNEPAILTRGLMYLNVDGRISEYYGQYDGKLYFRLWRSKTAKVQVNQTIYREDTGKEFLITNEHYCEKLIAQAHCKNEKNLDGTHKRMYVVALQPERTPRPKPTNATPSANVEQQTVSRICIYTDGARKETPTARKMIFGTTLGEDLNNQTVFASGAALIMDGNKIIKAIAIDGFDTRISDVQSFEAEEVPIIVTLVKLGQQVRGARILTDSQSVFKKLAGLKHKKTSEFAEDPYINNIQKLFQDLDIEILWMPSHTVDGKPMNKWSKDEKGNYAADLLTKGRYEEVFQIYQQPVLADSFELVNFNQEKYLSNIFKSSVYTFEKEGIPISDYQMSKEHRIRRVKDYLAERQSISTRGIEWTETTVVQAVKWIKKYGKISKSRISKLVYWKYADQQYNANRTPCLICGTGEDTRDHLLQCSDSRITAICTTTALECARLPIREDIYQRTSITRAQQHHLQMVIQKIVTTDSATRIGIFSKSQQDEIILQAQTLNLDEHLGAAISAEIEQQVAPWIRAMVAITRIRTNAVKSITVTREAKAKVQKQLTLPSSNIFDNFPPEEDDTEQRSFVISVLHGTARIITTFTSGEDFYDFCTTHSTRPWTLPLSNAPALLTTEILDTQDYSLQLWPRIQFENHYMRITPKADMSVYTMNNGLVARSTTDLFQFGSWRGITNSDRTLTNDNVQELVNLTMFVRNGNFYKLQEWIIELEQHLRHTKFHAHKKPIVREEINFLYQVYQKLEGLDTMNIDDEEGLYYQFSWDNELYFHLTRLLQMIRKYSQVFENTAASCMLTDIPIDFQQWESLATNRRGMLTIVENQSHYTILYPKERNRYVRTSKKSCEETVPKGTEHTISSCQIQSLAQEGTTKISTFHRDGKMVMRMTDNDYRLELLHLIHDQKLEYITASQATSIREKVKSFNRIKTRITEIRTGIDRMRLSRQMNRKIREALTGILTKLQITDKVCSEENTTRLMKNNSITQYLIQRNPSELGYGGKGD